MLDIDCYGDERHYESEDCGEEGEGCSAEEGTSEEGKNQSRGCLAEVNRCSITGCYDNQITCFEGQGMSDIRNLFPSLLFTALSCTYHYKRVIVSLFYISALMFLSFCLCV